MKSAHAARAGMTSDVVRWHGGAREDELPRRLAVVHCAPHVIPKSGLQLPLVEEAGCGARQQLGRIQSGEPPGRLVHIEAYLAARKTLRHPRLAGGARSFDENGARRREALLQLGVRNPRAVVLCSCHRRILLGCASGCCNPPNLQITLKQSDSQRIYERYCNIIIIGFATSLRSCLQHPCNRNRNSVTATVCSVPGRGGAFG